MRDVTYYDDKTLLKVREALKEVSLEGDDLTVGLTDENILDIITVIQNKGILFRERAK